MATINFIQMRLHREGWALVRMSEAMRRKQNALSVPRAKEVVVAQIRLAAAGFVRYAPAIGAAFFVGRFKKGRKTP
jgi:hypothetical protein